VSKRATLTGYSIADTMGDMYTLELDPPYGVFPRAVIFLSAAESHVLAYGTYQILKNLPPFCQSIQEALAGMGYALADPYGFLAVVAVVDAQRAPHGPGED
jgi:hypothetical protein